MGRLVLFNEPLDYKRVMRRIRRLYREGRTVVMPRAGRRLEAMRRDFLDLQHLVAGGTVTGHRVRGGQWQYTVEADPLESKVTRCVVEVDRMLVFVRIIK